MWLLYSVPMGLRRCGRCNRCSHETRWFIHKPLYYVHHLPEGRSMEAYEQDYGLYGGCHEPVVSRRNTPSVRLLFSLPHALVHHLISHSAEIHGFTEEQTNRAKDAFKNYGPPRGFASISSDPQTYSADMKDVFITRLRISQQTGSDTSSRTERNLAWMRIRTPFFSLGAMR